MKGPLVGQIQQIVPDINPDTLHPHEMADMQPFKVLMLEILEGSIK